LKLEAGRTWSNAGLSRLTAIAVKTRGRTAVRVLLAGAAALTAIAWLVILVAHSRDRYEMDQASGVVAALAEWVARRGTFYPALDAHGRYGGTRYMPLGLAVQGAATWVSSNVLVGTRVVSVGGMVACVAGVVIACRRFGAPWAVAAALGGILVWCRVGLQTAFDGRHDAAAVGLQLWAVLLVWPEPTVRRSRWAGVLAALAVMTKFTAVWGLLAGGWSLLRGDRRQAAEFARTALVAGLVAVAFFAAISRGRFLIDVTTLGAPGLLKPSSMVHMLPNLWTAARATGVATLAVIAAGAACAVVALASRRAGALAVAWLVAALVLLPIFTDPGAWTNHLLDVTTLGLVMAGWAVASIPVASVSRVAAEAAVLAVVGYGAFHLARVARSAVAGSAMPAITAHPLAGLRPPGEILSEDPYAPVSIGRLPVVLDPYMFVVLARRHPAWQAALIDRVRAHEFSLVLLSRPDPQDRWFDDYFGQPVMAAVAANYRLAGMAGDQYVFVPR